MHVWVPELFFTTGGIQAFSRHFLDALCAEIGAEEIRVVLKNDFSKDVPNANGFVNGCGDWPTPFRSGRFALECLRRSWRERPRLIVSTHLNFGPVAQIVRALTGVPYVLVAHGIDAWDLNSRSRQKALQKADLVLAVSRFTRNWLIQKTCVDSQRVQILPNTFLPERFMIGPKPPRLLEKYGFTSQTPVVLTVCRLEEGEQYKGYDQMIRALPRVLLDVPNTRYLLVGTGSDRSRVEKLAVELRVQNAVLFAGFVPDDELSEHYNLCDLFAMPSKAEGFGIVYLEALASGKPVLAGNKDGSRDALVDGELGLLVDPDDIDEIASETIRVLRRQHPHPNLFRREVLRQRATELFGFETFKRTLAERLRPFLQDDNT